NHRRGDLLPPLHKTDTLRGVPGLSCSPRLLANSDSHEPPAAGRLARRSTSRSRRMLDTTEAAFLRSIADAGEDNTARLVFSDWLEEHEETARAEFIRVQCDLAASGVPEERRHALRLRERALLDAHRRGWCEAFGLPIE